MGAVFPLAYPDLASIHTWRAVLWISVAILISSIGRLSYDVIKEIDKKDLPKAVKYTIGVCALAIFLIWYFWPQDQFDRQLDGLGMYALVRLYDTPEDKRKYILSLDTAEGAKADFYISAADIATLSVTDLYGEPHTLEVPLGRIPLDRSIALFAEVGLDEGTTALRVLVNGKEIQRRTLPFVVNLGKRQWKTKQLGAPLKIQEWLASDKTFSNAKIAALMDNIRKYVSPSI